MKIEILGPGCQKCTKLYENVKEAVEITGIDAQVIKIEDINKITEYGIMMTPGLVINGEVKVVGKLLSTEEIKALILG